MFIILNIEYPAHCRYCYKKAHRNESQWAQIVDY